MALIKCPECGNLVSDTAVCCPRCGATVFKTKNRKGANDKQRKELLIKCIVESVLVFLGLVLFLIARDEVFGHSSFFWKSGLWRRDKDTVIALIQLIIGLSLMVSSLISLLIATAKFKKLS